MRDRHGPLLVVIGLVLVIAAVAKGDEPAEPAFPVPLESSELPRITGPLPVMTAGDATPIGPDLTLDDLQAMALGANPTLEQARAEILRARGNQVQAGLYPNPIVGYTASEVSADGAGQQGVYLQQMFVTGGKLRLSRCIYAADGARAHWLVAEQELRVVNDVRREHYAVLTARRLVAIAAELVELSKDIVERTEAGLGNESSRIDVLQAKLVLQQAELFAQTTDRQHHAAWRRLQSVVGTPLAVSSLVGDIESGTPILEFEESYARLLATSPQLARAHAGVDRASAVIRRARVQPIPNVTVQASTQYDFGADQQIFGFQVGLPLPVTNKNQGNVCVATAERMRSIREIARLELELRRRLADEYRDYDVARARMGKIKNEILPTTSETLELSREAFNAGELSYLQLLVVQTEYVQANRRYIEALGEFWDAVVAIDGLLLDDGLTAPTRIGDP